MMKNYTQFFPYSQFRIGQEKLIEQIENSARKRKNFLLSAPNGSGKTIIALSALLPVAIENDLKILYLCRTHSQNSRVIKELMKVSELSSEHNPDLKINGLSIRGRNEMCLHNTLIELKTNPRDAMSVCRDLRKNQSCMYFRNLIRKKNELDNPILLSPDIFNKPLDADILIDVCKDQNLCPYFLSKFLLEEMRVIICNYQWVFNRFIRESFLKFIGRELQNCILVIDECHNIIDVLTDLNSFRITPYQLSLCRNDLERARIPNLLKFVNMLLNHLEKKKKSLNKREKAVNPEKFLSSIITKLGYSDLNEFSNLIGDLFEISASISEEKIANGEYDRDYLGTLAEFWKKWIDSYLLDNYFFCYNIEKRKGKKNISLEIVALDPRETSLPVLKECYASLHLSGTLNPYVYTQLMGLKQSGKAYSGRIAKSPFKKKNIKAIITEGVDTKRKNRTPYMYKKMIKKIDEVLYCTPANVGIFCASYKVLNALKQNHLEDIIRKNKKKLFIEKPGLSASENAFLMEDFKSMATSSDYGGVLLGVCGGRNSEGEDYPGDYMNAVIIAGFPYHLPTPRVNAKIKYYDKVFNHQGWEFAYLYPAIQRANQASGRPIRQLTDKGAIIFMDSRFKQKYEWISKWIQEEIEVVPDRKNAIIQNLFPFWNR
jgi:DNA excision repair protein ERCC-2